MRDLPGGLQGRFCRVGLEHACPLAHWSTPVMFGLRDEFLKIETNARYLTIKEVSSERRVVVEHLKASVVSAASWLATG